MIFITVPKASDWTKMLWLFSAPVIWIGLSQYFVLFRLFDQQADINKFYRALFHARRQANSKDVRDTYSHLREHSNSIFIVVVELSILAGLLALHASSTSRAISNLPSACFYQWLFIATVIWMLPTVFLWGRANEFEKFFSENSAYFLDSELFVRNNSSLKPKNMKYDYNNGVFWVLDPQDNVIGRIDGDEFVRSGANFLYRIDGDEVYQLNGEYLAGIEDGVAKTPEGRIVFTIKSEKKGCQS